MSELGGLRAVILSGMGEPFTHPEVYDMIAEVKRRGLYLTIITNLVASDPDRIIALDVDQLLIGLHAASQKAYQAFHPSFVSDEWQRVLVMLGKFRAAGKRYKHIHVICRENAHELVAMIRQASEYQASQVNFKLASLQSGTEAVRISEDQRRQLQSEWLPAAMEEAARLGVVANFDVFSDQLRAGDAATAPIEDIGCFMGYSYARILVDGTILYCCSPDVVTGHLAQSPFSEQWDGPRWNEVRHVGSLEASVQRGPLHVSGSAGISREPDYLSVSAGASASLDLLEKNLTPFVGFRYGHDDVGVKGRPRADWELLQKGGLQLGATFVINHFMIASVQLDADFERGYLAKPYRYIPLFAPGTGADIPVGAAIDEVNAKRIPERPIERLPSARNRYAVTGRIAARRGPATLRIDERLYTDSWGVSATTTDARVMIDLGSRVMIWPHLRFHAQSGASFWQRAYELLPTEEGAWTVPRYRTGDRELSKLNTYTGGLGGKFRLTDQADSIWHITCQLEAGYTSFFDALYITSRWSVLSVIGISAEWN